MKKRYFYKQKLMLYILSGLTALVVIGGLIYTSCKLAGVGTLVSFNHPADIVSLIILSIVGISMTWLVLCSGYTLKEDKFCYNLGFIYKSIEYSKICLIRQSSDKANVYLFYLTDKKGMVYDAKSNLNANIIQLLVNNKKFDEIIDFIKEKNSKTIYEIIPVVSKEKKNEGGSSK